MGVQMRQGGRGTSGTPPDAEEIVPQGCVACFGPVEYRISISVEVVTGTPSKSHGAPGYETGEWAVTKGMDCRL